jgi:hypothetical protein
MFKRFGALSVAIAVVALAVGVAIPAAASSRAAHEHHTISVVAIVTELNLVSVSTKGPSLGDEIVFSQKLLQDGNEVGHAGAVCTTVSLERQEAQCIATYSFSGGQITAQTLIILGSMAPYLVTITGGSGEYEGAEGEIQVSPVSASQGMLTFDLD